MTQLHKKPEPSGKPVKPNKPSPTQEQGAKVSILVALTEERVRKIVRDELRQYLEETRTRQYKALVANIFGHR